MLLKKSAILLPILVMMLHNPTRASANLEKKVGPEFPASLFSLLNPLKKFFTASINLLNAPQSASITVINVLCSTIESLKLEIQFPTAAIPSYIFSFTAVKLLKS